MQDISPVEVSLCEPVYRWRGMIARPVTLNLNGFRCNLMEGKSEHDMRLKGENNIFFSRL